MRWSPDGRHILSTADFQVTLSVYGHSSISKSHQRDIQSTLAHDVKGFYRVSLIQSVIVWTLKFYAPERNLRSSSQNFLAVPFSKMKISYGDRAFSVGTPKLWNNLPLQLRNSGSFNIFKSNLKTFLFKYVFCL